MKKYELTTENPADAKHLLCVCVAVISTKLEGCKIRSHYADVQS
jgi:hypothetical protein